MKDTVKFNRGSVKMIAHRGASQLEKENTHSAFIAAGNRSFFGIETDAHFTADGKVVLLHNDDTESISGVKHVIRETDLETLRSLPLLDINNRPGRVDLRIPLLSEYIRICKDYGKVCVTELKNPMSRDEVEEIVRIVREEQYVDGTMFISFHFDNLTKVHEFLPNQKVQLLAGSISEPLLAKMVENHIDVDIDYRSLNPAEIRRFHDHGMEVNCCTLDDPEIAERLVSWGVDYITTNRLE